MAPLLELEHVFDAQQGFLRPLQEGRLAVDNIASIGVKSRVGNEVAIEATVVRSTNISKEPVTVNITIRCKEAAVDRRIKDLSCSCPAGACKMHCCKHAMAVIIFLERKDESQIEKLTCTDTRQAWDNVKEAAMSRFDPGPLLEFCHVPQPTAVYRRPINDVTQEIKRRIKKMSLEDRPKSEAATFWSAAREPKKTVRRVLKAIPKAKLCSFYRNSVSNPHYLLNRTQQLSQELFAKCTPDERDFFEKNIVVSVEEAQEIFLNSKGQDNDVWDGARFGRVTGSTSYELFTYYNNKNPDWDSKLLGVFESHFKNDAMNAGNFYESHALKKYILAESEKQSGIDVLKVGIIINPLLPWLGFSADAVVFKENIAFKLWENKTPVSGMTTKASDICKYLAYMDKGGKLKHKCKHYVQIQLGMILLNLSACDFSVYCTGPMNTKNLEPQSGLESIHVETVIRNDSFCDKYLERLCHVFFEKILPWLTRKSQ